MESWSIAYNGWLDMIMNYHETKFHERKHAAINIPDMILLRRENQWCLKGITFCVESDMGKSYRRRQLFCSLFQPECYIQKSKMWTPNSKNNEVTHLPEIIGIVKEDEMA